MSNNSQGAGYLVPTSTQGFPKGLSLTQFIQTVLVGVSEIPGTLVRPKYQVEPLSQPDIYTDWLSFGILSSAPDANAYLNTNTDNSYSMQRHALTEISLSFYGPNALDNYELVRDGFQVTQNLAALKANGLGFVEVTRALRVPDLINERWVDRYESSVILRKETQRTYAVTTFVSANGTINTVVGTEDYVIAWTTNT